MASAKRPPVISLAGLQATPITGCFNSDQGLWVACEDFILDESQTREDRLAAVRVIDQITGEDELAAGPPDLDDIVRQIKGARS